MKYFSEIIVKVRYFIILTENLVEDVDSRKSKNVFNNFSSRQMYTIDFTVKG